MKHGKFSTLGCLILAIVAAGQDETTGDRSSADRSQLPLFTAGVLLSGEGFDDDRTDFDILIALVRTAGLEAAGDDPDLNATLFAPTDGAFLDTFAAVGFTDLTEEEVVSLFVAGIGTFGSNLTETLENYLSYHVVRGKLMAADVLNMTSLVSANRFEDVITRGGDDMEATQLGDYATALRDPMIIGTDGVRSNGIVHVIDRFLLSSALATALQLLADESAGVEPTAASGCDRTCDDGDICTESSWSDDPVSCLPSPPKCYLLGARNKGVEGEEYVPYAPCCAGVESSPNSGMGYGMWCIAPRPDLQALAEAANGDDD